MRKQRCVVTKEEKDDLTIFFTLFITITKVLNGIGSGNILLKIHTNKLNYIKSCNQEKILTSNVSSKPFFTTISWYIQYPHWKSSFERNWTIPSSPTRIPLQNHLKLSRSFISQRCHSRDGGCCWRAGAPGLPGVGGPENSCAVAGAVLGDIPPLCPQGSHGGCCCWCCGGP